MMKRYQLIVFISLMALIQPLYAAEQTTENVDPWGNSTSSEATSPNADWLNTPIAPQSDVVAFDVFHPFKSTVIPLDNWIEGGINWAVDNFRPMFQLIRAPVEVTLNSIETALQAIPSTIMIILLALLSWQLVSARMAMGTVVSLVLIGLIGTWMEAMTTLSLVLTSLFFCLLIGLPTGIWLTRSDRASAIVRPLLDAMQTTPAFVYLIPIVMLFGIGNVPGVVVTIIFALPPVIRLTMLGIRQVPEDLIEAAHSFGANSRQLLFKVQLPLAMPTIMAGVNQTLMLSLSMVVIASMIAVGGLGQMVLRGIGRLDMGMASVGGVGIVLLAIVLDRLTQAMGQKSHDKNARHWHQRGPIGLFFRLTSRVNN
jgi:glycine betaine/proline transport system permease protein